MNLPNKLTLSRVVMVPFFTFFLLMVPEVPAFKWVAFALFVIASLTDLADGKIARKYNLITNFGKFMDPLADKLLVSAALIGLSALHVVPAWITITIICREMVVNGLRFIAAERGIVIAAGIWGKWKTTFQMIMLCVQMLVMDDYLGQMTFTARWIVTTYTVLTWIGIITMYIALVLTIISMVDYLWQNRQVFLDIE